MTPTPELAMCQCEHRCHESSGKRTVPAPLSPAGNPGHRYGAKFYDVQPVITTYGKFNLCRDCREDCHSRPAMEIRGRGY